LNNIWDTLFAEKKDKRIFIFLDEFEELLLEPKILKDQNKLVDFDMIKQAYVNDAIAFKMGLDKLDFRLSEIIETVHDKDKLKNKKEIDKIVEHYLKAASLWEEVKDRLKMPASRLSIGQQQRLCLARGLAVEPEIILGDEPTSALDPQSSQYIEKKFIELKDKYTIVVVTHILRQARRMADYIIFIHMGEIIECGPASEILENPKEQKTKEYVSGIIS